jgi:hypothetical protein
MLPERLAPPLEPRPEGGDRIHRTLLPGPVPAGVGRVPTLAGRPPRRCQCITFVALIVAQTRTPWGHGCGVIALSNYLRPREGAAQNKQAMKGGSA